MGRFLPRESLTISPKAFFSILSFEMLSNICGCQRNWVLMFFFPSTICQDPSGQLVRPGGIILDLLIQKMSNVCSVECTVLGAGGRKQ